jgi:predicted DNA-binding transcriptional regulator AlpA
MGRTVGASTRDDPSAASWSPTPLTTATPWAIVGISRSAYDRLMAAGRAPQALDLKGSRRRWRIADVVRFVEHLRCAR